MASQMQEPISDTASHVVQQAGEKVDQAVTVAKQQTTSRLDGERERVADGLYSTAHALRQVSQQLRDQEQGSIASMADRAAQQAERASGYLRSRDLPELLNETEQLGRAHPLPFMGGAIALGLLGVRFLKSSRAQVESAPSPGVRPPRPRCPPLPLPHQIRLMSRYPGAVDPSRRHRWAMRRRATPSLIRMKRSPAMAQTTTGRGRWPPPRRVLRASVDDAPGGE